MKALQDAARAYLGVPFIHQGRTRNGLDCVGLLVLVAKDLGIPLVDFTAYTLRPRPKELLDGLKRNCERVDVAEVGDILVFEFIGPGWPQHTAIRTDKGLIHALRDVGRVVETSFDAYWQDRLNSSWRLR